MIIIYITISIILYIIVGTIVYVILENKEDSGYINQNNIKTVSIAWPFYWIFALGMKAEVKLSEFIYKLEKLWEQY